METKKLETKKPETKKEKNPCTNGCIHYSYNDTVNSKPNVTTGNGAKVFHGVLGHYCKKHNYYMVLVDNVPDIIQCDDFTCDAEKPIDYDKTSKEIKTEINGLNKRLDIMEKITKEEEIVDYSQDIKEIRGKIAALNNDPVSSKFHIENMTGNIKT